MSQSLGRLLSFLGLGVALFGSASSCKRAPAPASEATTSDPALAQGRELYGRMCAVCHGAKGEGYAADFAPRLAQPDFLASVSDDYLKTAIVEGRAGTPMSAWGKAHSGPLDDQQVDAVIHFLRGWEVGPRPILDESKINGGSTRGTDIFNERCKLCHGEQGKTGPNVRIGSAQIMASASNGFLRYAISRGRPGTAMPAFAESLGPEGIENVIAALRSWQTPPPPPSATQNLPPAPLPLGPVPLNPKGPEPIGFKTYPENTSALVIKKQLDRGARMAILDARAPSDYLQQHIQGAVSVPFYDPKPYLDKLPKNTWLVCYCSCPHAESGNLARGLIAAGFKKVTVLDEGLGFWANQQYGVVTKQ